jgi:hypothetical protein
MQKLRSFPSALVLLAAFCLALPGCKLTIKPPQGGRVVSSDGAYICEEGQTCRIDVVDLFFDQTFIGEPAPGYYFSHWNELEGFLCGGQETPCNLSTAGFEGNPALQSVLESDETFYLQAVFVRKLEDCPEPGLVISPGFSDH